MNFELSDSLKNLLNKIFLKPETSFPVLVSGFESLKETLT